jgi:hypothetical protein
MTKYVIAYIRTVKTLEFVTVEAETPLQAPLTDPTSTVQEIGLSNRLSLLYVVDEADATPEWRERVLNGIGEFRRV